MKYNSYCNVDKNPIMYLLLIAKMHHSSSNVSLREWNQISNREIRASYNYIK